MPLKRDGLLQRYLHQLSSEIIWYKQKVRPTF